MGAEPQAGRGFRRGGPPPGPPPARPGSGVARRSRAGGRGSAAAADSPAINSPGYMSRSAERRPQSPRPWAPGALQGSGIAGPGPPPGRDSGGAGLSPTVAPRTRRPSHLPVPSATPPRRAAAAAHLAGPPQPPPRREVPPAVYPSPSTHPPFVQRVEIVRHPPQLGPDLSGPLLLLPPDSRGRLGGAARQGPRGAGHWRFQVLLRGRE